MNNKILAHWRGVFGCLIVCTLMSCAKSGTVNPQNTVFTVDPKTIYTDAPRYGVNLGGPSTWGAEQLRANILNNPGFEPILDRSIVIVSQADAISFNDNTPWLARQKNFWNGGTYNIRTGAQAGKSGDIVFSDRLPNDGVGTFQHPITAPAPMVGDIVVVTAPSRAEAAPMWWTGPGQIAASNDVPPNSGGTQSLRLMAIPGKPAGTVHYNDAISDRAGKLLLVNGSWRFSVWARSDNADAVLTVSFDRQGKKPFFKTDIKPGKAWQQYVFDFNSLDDGPSGILTLSLTATQGEILIDDAYLGEAEAGAGGFRKTVIDTLRALKPGYLREWQGQLADTLSNRLKDDFARQPSRSRPGTSASIHTYGLPDFMALCAATNAQPWVVAPTTLDDNEWISLGKYLRQAADQYHFTEVLVEFGNENWNTQFRSAGIPDPKQLGMVSDRGFKLLKEGFGTDTRLKTVLGGQFGWAENSKNIAQNSQQADILSFAPYFFDNVNQGDTPESAAKHMFADSSEQMRQNLKAIDSSHKPVNIYEVNLHTTGGDGDIAVRNTLVTSAASGSALARRLIQNSLLGIKQQAIYTLAGFDGFTTNNKRQLVRIWGIARDLTVPAKLRPTGLALAMLNRVVQGNAQQLICQRGQCDQFTGIAFNNGRSIALVSASGQTLPVTIPLPCDANDTLRITLLDGSNLQANNEDQTMVSLGESSLRCTSKEITFDLPPYSLITATLDP